MLISVIIPTYKPQHYLYDCLISLRNQTFDKSKYEIILVLNGCCEPYYSQINQYIHSNMEGVNIYLFQIDEGGVSNARNVALDKAKGDYITFVDDDDYVSSDYLTLLFSEASKDCVTISDTLSFLDGDNNYNSQYYLHKEYLSCLSKNYITLFHARRFFNGPVMKLFHKDIINNRRFNCHFENGEDNLFMFYISDRINRVKFVSEQAVYYRRYRSGSAIMRKRSLMQRLLNSHKIILVETIYFFQRPFHYNWLFYTSRILAEYKSLIAYMLGIHKS